MFYHARTVEKETDCAGSTPNGSRLTKQEQHADSTNIDYNSFFAHTGKHVGNEGSLGNAEAKAPQPPENAHS